MFHLAAGLRSLSHAFAPGFVKLGRNNRTVAIEIKLSEVGHAGARSHLSRCLGYALSHGVAAGQHEDQEDPNRETFFHHNIPHQNRYKYRSDECNQQYVLARN